MWKKDVNDDRKEVVDSFIEYLSLKNKKLIKRYNKKTLCTVLNIMEPYKDELWYKEVEKRIEEINEWERYLMRDVLVVFVILVFSGLLAIYFGGCFSNTRDKNSMALCFQFNRETVSKLKGTVG